MGYAVLACTACGSPMPVESRNASTSCPACRERVEHARARTLWAGSDPREARAFVADARARLAGADPASLRPPPSLPRHDSPLDAAAAKARAIVNKSQRAEAVALWATRLMGDVPHAQLVDGLQRAGLDRERAELEVVRMLACDILLEPRAGAYRVIDP